MNNETIYQLLSDSFDKVIQIDEKVYRTEKKYNDLPFAIYYFDTSENIINPDFDINDYQEKYISTDYYTHPGYLQWNFYLIYICTPENIRKIKKVKKVEVEKNKIYTRKYIVTPQELTTLSSFFSISSTPGVPTNSDLDSIWIQKLKEAQLDVVFLTGESYKDGLNRYLGGAPILQEEENIFSESIMEETEITSFINKIILDEYRPYPEQTEFKLGTFNLINGVNGCGKTSFLEAIELFYCGKTFKEKDLIQEWKFRFFFEGDKPYQYNPKDNKKYRLRDRRWYNKIYPKGNRLCESFAKYNFFDSDAGYRLSKSDNQEEIKTAFMDIALGENINKLETRIKGFFSRFKDQLNEYDKEIEKLKNSIEEENKTIEELSLIPNEYEKLLILIQDEAHKMQWTSHIPSDINDDITLFERELIEVQTTLNTIDNDLSWIPSISLAIIQKELKSYKSKLSRLEDFNIRIKDLEKQKKDFDKVICELQELDELMVKCEKYYSELNLLHLIGLNKQIEEETKLLSRLNHSKELLNQVNIQLFKLIEKNIEDYREKLYQQKTTFQRRKADLNLKVKQISQSFNEFEQLVTDIKSLGKKFILSAEKVEACPLCNSEFGKDELIKRIEIYDINFDNSVLNLFQGEILDLENKLSELDEALNNLSKVEEVSDLFFERGILNREDSLKTIIGELEQLYDLINNTQSKIKQLSSLSENFTHKGLSESEARTLMRAIEDRFNGLKLDPSMKEIFDKKRKDIIASLSKNEKDAEKCNQKLLDEKNKKSKFIIEEDLSDVNIISKRIGKLETSIYLLNQLSIKLCLASNNELSKITKDVKNLQVIFEKFKTAKTENETKNKVIHRCQEKIKGFESKKEAIKSPKNNATKAFAALDDILTNHSKEEFFQKFLEENKKEIVDIFKKIHSPKEFNDIILDDDAIKLKREGEQNLIPLTQISTGQRTALALSLFLSLNNKVENGPKVILFDDPIVSIDDLNMLSFLDYLRFLATERDRQIFFATANTKLKNLLQKKFEFLEEEMKSIEFNR